MAIINMTWYQDGGTIYSWAMWKFWTVACGKPSLH
jgi:hypothetical protein